MYLNTCKTTLKHKRSDVDHITLLTKRGDILTLSFDSVSIRKTIKKRNITENKINK